MSGLLNTGAVNLGKILAQSRYSKCRRRPRLGHRTSRRATPPLEAPGQPVRKRRSDCSEAILITRPHRPTHTGNECSRQKTALPGLGPTSAAKGGGYLVDRLAQIDPAALTTIWISPTRLSTVSATSAIPSRSIRSATSQWTALQQCTRGRGKPASRRATNTNQRRAKKPAIALPMLNSRL